MSKLKAMLFGKLHYKFLLRSVLVLILGVISFEIMMLKQTTQIVEQLTLDKMRNSVENISSRIDDELARLRTDLYVFKELPSLESFYLNTRYGLINEANGFKQSVITFFDKQNARNPAYLAFRICDTRLQQLSIYSHNDELTRKIDNQTCANPTTDSGKHYRLRRDLIGSSVLIANHEAYRGDELLGYVELYFDLTPYLKTVEQYKILSSGFVAVADESRDVISTMDEIKAELFDQVFSQLQENRNEKSVFSIKDSKQNKLLVYYYQMPGINWTMSAFVYEHEIFAQFDEQFTLALWLLLLMVIIEILFLNFFTQRLITRRITSLVRATQQVLNGNYNQRVSEIGYDEISQLNSSFNQMTSSLQTQLSALDNERSRVNKNKQQMQDIIDNTSALISVKDIDGQYLLVNNAYKEYIGLASQEILGKTDYDLFTHEFASAFRANDNQVIQTAQPMHVEEASINARGIQSTFIIAKFPLFDENEKVYATCGIATDISSRIKEEKSLQRLNAKLSLSDAVLENIDEGVVITNDNFEIIEANPAMIKLFGYSEEELVGQKTSILRSHVHNQEFFDELYAKLKSKGSWHGEIWESTKDGTILPQLLTVTSLRDHDNKITHYAGIYSDISDLKQTEAKLQRLAHYDSLTGLANRTLLEERTSQAILNAQRGKHKVTVLFIDLDNFKYINDTLGHDVGDQLLKSVANRFNNILRESDTLARLGGDEFIILLSKTQHTSDAEIIANKIKAAGSLAFNIDEHELYISTSIGIAVYPDNANSTHELLKSADMAMYSVKDSGKNNFQFFTQAMNHAAVDRLKIEKKLRKAIQKNELKLYYQPQIDPQSGATIKIEALLRWPQTGNQFIPPDLFVPIAEESGLIVVLGEWVLRQALNDFKTINQGRQKPIIISINLSARQFRHHDIAAQLHQIVIDAEVFPEFVEFEITEGILVDDFQLAERILIELKRLGFSIALDDFGKGYSSLSYLRHFPIDTLKIDREFLRDVITDQRNQTIVKACIDMGKALGMSIVCEGVETSEQYAFIRNLNHVSVQGYYCSKALPLEQLGDFLKNEKTPS